MKYAGIVASAYAVLAVAVPCQSTTSTLKPWIKGTGLDCPQAIGDESCVGTDSFCNTFFEFEEYENPEACFADRDPEPQPAERV
ncbi:Uncharacterized protein TPAR_09276 [Tolypocladium paradoxum]|uniref:Extracellular membrane protein CFEM domain-containing protein n=1 Tax=Tolypocladium paradoxum TaxID=94208 RepID=A0A2S4KL92_9HYPO|nr:Uncharacterized protein TPAR_09276 [Tolypocladium paradoxum]